MRNQWAADLIIGLAVDAFGIEHREIVHGLGIAGFGSREIEAARGFEVLLDAHALFIEAAEAELRRHEALLGGALEPFRGVREVLRHAAAFGEAHRDLEFGGRIALGGRGAQAAGDRGWNFVRLIGACRGWRGCRRGARQAHRACDRAIT